jgi:hypothetical protein
MEPKLHTYWYSQWSALNASEGSSVAFLRGDVDGTLRNHELRRNLAEAEGATSRTSGFV